MGVRDLGFVVFPTAWLGTWGTDVEADTGGDEIRIDGGGRGSGFPVQGADGRKRIAVHSSGSRVQVFELAGDAKDAKIVAGRNQGRVALGAEPAFVLAVDCMSGESAVWAETVEVLGVEIEVNGSDKEVSHGLVSLSPVTIRPSAGHDGLRGPEVELVLAAKKERRVKGVQGFDSGSSIGRRLVDHLKSPAELAPRGDATDVRTDRIEGEEIDCAFLGVVELKVTEKLGVFTGLFGSCPVLCVKGTGREQDEGKPIDAPHDFTCRWAARAAFPTAWTNAPAMAA